MNPGDIIQRDDTRMEVVAVECDNVRLRYLTPHATPPMREWFDIAVLVEHGWRVIPAVEVPPCWDV